MFLLNRGHITKIDSSLNLEGIVVSASALHMPVIERRALSDTNIRIFDPQMYFPLDRNESCSSTYNKLATYPWYNPSAPIFDSCELKITDFKANVASDEIHLDISHPEEDGELINRIEECINFQNSLEVSHLIIPTTLVDDPEDQFTIQLDWINKGLEICENYDRPKLITLALADNVLLSKNFEENELLQTIIDNLTTYDNADGFYIVISRSNPTNHITERKIVQAVLELSYILGHRMQKEVFFNFIDSLGFLALAAGASYFASGYTNKEKRLNFFDFEDSSSGGAPLPHFYSYSLIGDLYSKRDLEKLKDSHLLNLISNDFTSHSQNLNNALTTNINVNSVPDWAETRNNISKAKLHRADLQDIKARYITSLPFEERISYALSWLQQAEINTTYISERFKNNPISEDFRHITVWRNCFENFINKYSLL